MKIIITGEPQAKQSARFRIQKSKKTDKSFVMSYQKKSVVDNASNIGKVALSQLPLGFVPYDCPILVKAVFVFPPLSSWNKATKLLFESGEKIYKVSKPDVDNLQKSVFDGLNGIVYVDDSRIAEIVVQKIYGKEPRIELEFHKL